MDKHSSPTHTTDNSNDQNYIIAKKDYLNFINMNYLKSGIFLNKNLHNGLNMKTKKEKENKKEKERENKK